MQTHEALELLLDNLADQNFDEFKENLKMIESKGISLNDYITEFYYNKSGSFFRDGNIIENLDWLKDIKREDELRSNTLYAFIIEWDIDNNAQQLINEAYPDVKFNDDRSYTITFNDKKNCFLDDKYMINWRDWGTFESFLINVANDETDDVDYYLDAIDILKNKKVKIRIPRGQSDFCDNPYLIEYEVFTLDN